MLVRFENINCLRSLEIKFSLGFKTENNMAIHRLSIHRYIQIIKYYV